MSRLYQRDLAEHRNRWEFARDGRAPWDREARIDMEYEAGKIWTPQELSTLEARRQPATRYQIIRPMVNLVCGIEAQNRADLKVLPRTPKQIDSAEARTKLAKFEMDRTHFDRHMSRAFRDCTITGVGWLDMGYGNDPSQDRIAAKRVDPFQVYRDPASVEADLSDALDLFRALWMRGTDLARLFPRFRAELLAMCGLYDSGNDYQRLSHSSDYANTHNGEPPGPWEGSYNHGQSSLDYGLGVDKRRGMVQAVERWYRTWEAKDYVKYRDGRILELTEATAPTISEAIVSGDAFWPETGVFCNVRVAVFAGDILLSESESPYTHEMFPLVPIVAYEDEHGLPCGLVRSARDPAKEFNSRRVSMLKRALSNTWLYEQGAFTNVDAARRALMQNEALVELAEGGLAKVQRQNSMDTVAVEAELAAQAQKMANDSVGIVAELMGHANNAKSGTAIDKLQAQGQTSLYTLFDNRNWALLTCGKILQSLIADTYTVEQAVRVTDSGRGVEFITINQQTEDGIQNDISNGEFDVVLSLDSQKSTNMIAQLEALNAFLANADPVIKTAFAPEVARLAGLPNSADTIPMLERLVDSMLKNAVGIGLNDESQTSPPAQALNGQPPAPTDQPASPILPAPSV